MAKWCVVVPSNRPERAAQFWGIWDPHFSEHDVELILVKDEPPWTDIPDWIPRQSDMIRSWGFYKAWQTGCDYILSLDDDVSPAGNDILSEYEAWFDASSVLSDYLSVGALTTSNEEMRGFPHRQREPVEVALQYGGWHGVLDFDAETQIRMGGVGHNRFHEIAIPVPRGCAFTGCSMNMAFRREYTPIMWQLPLLDGRYDRYGDIWSGLLAKLTFDTVGKAIVINGHASVMHDRASDPQRNLQRELPGRFPNEGVWEALTEDKLEEDHYGIWDVYVYYAGALCAYIATEFNDHEYADHFDRAMNMWLDLFSYADVPA